MSRYEDANGRDEAPTPDAEVRDLMADAVAHAQAEAHEIVSRYSLVLIDDYGVQCGAPVGLDAANAGELLTRALLADMTRRQIQLLDARNEGWCEAEPPEAA